jgi:hypothetical protein
MDAKILGLMVLGLEAHLLGLALVVGLEAQLQELVNMIITQHQLNAHYHQEKTRDSPSRQPVDKPQPLLRAFDFQ